MTTAASQLSFAPIRLALKRPVVTIKTAMGFLGADFSEDDVLGLIDSGAVEVAWNVGSISASRKEVRILAHSLDSYIRLGGVKPMQPLADSLVLKAVLPPQADGKPWIETIAFAESLLIGSDLANDLLREGSLIAFRGSEPRRGRGGSALITRESALQFLKQRRIP